MRLASVVAVLGAFAGIWLGAAACSSFSGDDESGTVDGAAEGAAGEASRDDAGVSDGGGDGGCVGSPTDPKNCGRCGHDCQGGACADASCKPFRVLDGGPNVVSLAVNDAGIHFINDVRTEVLTCPPAGCAGGAKVLAGNVTGAQELVAVADHLVVRSATAVYQVGPLGGSTLVNTYVSSRSLTSDGTRYAYYTAEIGSTKIWRVDPKGDAGAELVLEQNNAHGVATNGARIFFVFDDNSKELIKSCDAASCGTSTSDLVNTGRPALDTAARLAATKNALFWARSSGVETCKATGCTNSTNMYTVAGARAIAVDEDYVYFTARADGDSGSVERCSLAGCADRVTLATGFKPQALVVTGSAIYWATENNGQTPSAIWRLAK